MSHLSSHARRQMRKDLIRLRMEMNRQQLHYHAQPLLHPMEQIKSMLRPGPNSPGLTQKTPLMIGSALLLTLFGKRLGVVGKLARAGLTLYPLVRSLQRVRAASRTQGPPAPR
jgi:hypothetical protein